MNDGRTRSGKATAEAMTPEQRKERAKAGAAKRAELAAMPKVTHRGELKIGDIILSCAVLDNGKRILAEHSVINAITTSGASGASKRRRLAEEENDRPQTPLFLASNRLTPYITKEMLDGPLNKISYNDKGRELMGYDASVLPVVCEIWLKARDAGVLQKQQLPKAERAYILMRGLAHVGIAALVDEATGYEKDKAKDELAKILEAFVAKELQPWLKTFPDDFYKHIFRIYNMPYPPEKTNFRPSFIGRLTNDVVYARLAPELLPELKKEASKIEKKAKLHQFLTSDVGHPKLREHLASLITLLKLSSSPNDFKNKVNLIHPKFNQTIPFDFSE